MARGGPSACLLYQGLLLIHCEGLAEDMGFSMGFRSAGDTSLVGADDDAVLGSEGGY